MNAPSAADRLFVPRIEDLPYWTSPPVQYVFEHQVFVNAGLYTWNSLLFASARPVLENALYYIRSFTLSADITEQDFLANLVTAPTFQLYRTADSQTVMLREPIVMNRYYDQFDFRFAWSSSRVADQLFGNFAAAAPAVLTQGVNLIGKNFVILKAVLCAQEIVDEDFVKAFRHLSYPKV